MDKNGRLTFRSPCVYCGAPGVGTVNGDPACGEHVKNGREKPLPQLIQKVAIDMSEPPTTKAE